MVERERDLLLGQLRRYVEQNGQPWEEFEATDEYTQMKTTKLEEARQRVLTSLVLGAVVSEEKLTVNDEEMAPYYAELAMRYQLRPDQFEEFANNEDVRRQVAEEVLTGKVVELLVSSAKINFVPDECTEDHDHAAHGHSGKAVAKADKAESKTEAKAAAEGKEKPKAEAGKKASKKAE
jgi:FKBP-type peptidyl-prolyl cis-trans isomerase (trigger factor)